jgi:hypothetical protein
VQRLLRSGWWRHWCQVDLRSGLFGMGLRVCSKLLIKDGVDILQIITSPVVIKPLDPVGWMEDYEWY